MRQPDPATHISSNRRAVFITSDPEVYQSLLARLQDPHEGLTPEGLIYERGTSKTGRHSWDVFLFEIDHYVPQMETAVCAAVELLQPSMTLVFHTSDPHADTEPWRVEVASEIQWLKGDSSISYQYQIPLLVSQRARAVNRKVRERYSITTFKIDLYPGSRPQDFDVIQWLSGLAVLPILISGTWDGEHDYPTEFAFDLLASLSQPQTQPFPGEAMARLYLSHVTIDNIRSLAALDWSIPPERARGWHVIIGNNGAGKSALLRAVALALMGEEDAQALRQDFGAWLRHGSDAGQISVTVTSLTPPPSPPDGEDAEPPPMARLAFTRLPEGAGIRHERDSTLPVIFSAAFGPFRRLSGGDPDLERELSSYPLALRHLTLFSERPALAESLEWLKTLDHRRLEKHPDGGLLERVQTFLNQPGFLPHGTRLERVTSEAIVFTDGNGAQVPIEELSDGFRSILGLTLELLRHLTTASGAAQVLSREDPPRVLAPGVVLIDEVDAHLHPTWQREIGVLLVRLFPEVQFLVTSHSPLVCQAAEHGTVFRLPRPGSDEAGRMLTGVELDRVRFGDVLDAYGTGAFGEGVTRSEHSKEMLRTLARLNLKELEDGLSPDEQAEQARLRGVLGTHAYQLPALEPGHDPHRAG